MRRLSAGHAPFALKCLSAAFALAVAITVLAATGVFNFRELTHYDARGKPEVRCTSFMEKMRDFIKPMDTLPLHSALKNKSTRIAFTLINPSDEAECSQANRVIRFTMRMLNEHADSRRWKWTLLVGYINWHHCEIRDWQLEFSDRVQFLRYPVATYPDDVNLLWLQNEPLWPRIQAYEYLLVFHTDGFVIRAGMDSYVDKLNAAGLVYSGAPWPLGGPIKRNMQVGNGGFSLRNVAVFRDLIQTHGKEMVKQYHIYGKPLMNEDLFFSTYLPQDQIAPPHIANELSWELGIEDLKLQRKSRAPLGFHYARNNCPSQKELAQMATALHASVERIKGYLPQTL